VHSLERKFHKYTRLYCVIAGNSDIHTLCHGIFNVTRFYIYSYFTTGSWIWYQQMSPVLFSKATCSGFKSLKGFWNTILLERNGVSLEILLRYLLWWCNWRGCRNCQLLRRNKKRVMAFRNQLCYMFFFPKRSHPVGPMQNYSSYRFFSSSFPNDCYDITCMELFVQQTMWLSLCYSYITSQTLISLIRHNHTSTLWRIWNVCDVVLSFVQPKFNAK
jgi:hypothetical protein